MDVQIIYLDAFAARCNNFFGLRVGFAVRIRGWIVICCFLVLVMLVCRSKGLGEH